MSAINLPVTISCRNGHYGIFVNEETKKILGSWIGCYGFGKTKEEAIANFYNNLAFLQNFNEYRIRSYQRYIPFTCGKWKEIGGSWFSIFGFHFYFRYGKNMKYGWYIPFTKLNISITNHWRQFNKWKTEYFKNTKESYEKIS